MTVPVLALLGFAAWTLVLLISTVGVYRWTRILTGRMPIRAFRADRIEGADWYQRAMRAHANCIENLPVFVAIVFALYVSETVGTAVDSLCLAIVTARVAQSLVHVCFAQRNAVVAVRFAFFFVQIVGFFSLIVLAGRQAWTL